MGDGFMLMEEIAEDSTKHSDTNREAGASKSQPQSQPIPSHASNGPMGKHEEEDEDSNPGRYRVRRVAVCIALLCRFFTYRE